MLKSFVPTYKQQVLSRRSSSSYGRVASWFQNSEKESGNVQQVRGAWDCPRKLAVDVCGCAVSVGGNRVVGLA